MSAFASASQNPICVRPSASATLKWLGGFADDMSDKPHRDRAEPAIIRRYHVAARHRDRAGKRTAQQDFARLQLFSPLRQAICQPRDPYRWMVYHASRHPRFLDARIAR